MQLCVSRLNSDAYRVRVDVEVRDADVTQSSLAAALATDAFLLRVARNVFFVRIIIICVVNIVFDVVFHISRQSNRFGAF